MKIVVSCVVVGLLIIWWSWPQVLSIVAPIVLTNEEINACAVEAAIEDYRREYDWKTKTWTPNARSRDDAIQSLIVDSGEHPNFIRVAEGYKQSIGLRTVYDSYVERGREIAMKKKLSGETIIFPSLKVADGYHVTRWNGSASLVKDGAPKPIFGKTLPNGTTIWSDGKAH